MGAPKPRLAWATPLACALLALVPAPAWATPAWTSPQNLAAVPTTDPISPVVGVDAAGDAVALWGDNGTSRDSAAVWAAVRPAGGGWQAPVQLFGAAGAAWVGGFDLAVNARGEAVAVWEAYHCALVGATTTVCNYQPVQAAVGSALTGSWQAPVTLGEAASTTSSSYAGPSPRVAIDARGNATAVWQHYDGSQYTLSAARLSSTTGAWTAPTAIFGNSASSELPDLAVDARGDTVVGYGSDATSYPAGAPGWTAPVSVTSGIEPIAQVAIDAHGNAIATWIGSHTDINNNVQWLDYVAAMPAGGAWQAPVALSDGQTTASDARISVDAAGDAAAVWSGTLNGVTIVDARTRPATSSDWYPVTAISGSAASFQMPDVTVDSNGDAIALWQQHSGGDTSDVTMQAAVHPALPANASWEPLTSISSALTGIGAVQRVTHMAADAQGDVAAVWYGSGAIQAAGHDGGGPSLNALTIPSTGTAGQALSFTVSPLDVWSALGATNWSFGDGTTSTGQAVGH
ncbi:MAG: hypothetical protein ACYCXW_17840, partial [Solirubrobacteraceae bacterium]